MIYYLAVYLKDSVPELTFLRLVVDSITFRAIGGAMTALLFTIMFGGRIILNFYRSGQRDITRRYTHFPTSPHQAKTYGGGLIIAAILLGIGLWCKVHTGFVWLSLAGFLWFAGLGALDDYMKVRYSNADRGLSELGKLVLQVSYGLGFGIIYIVEAWSPAPPGLATQLYLPFFKYPVVDLAWMYVPFIAFTVVAISNSVNLADGVDGLAIMPVGFVMAVYGVFAYVASHATISQFLIFPFMPGIGELTIICAVVFGACLGFLWFNSYPANVIMGDTGSMALGGLLGTVAVLIKQEFLFLIIGGVFVGEALSSLVQEKIGVRWLGRRILYSAPIHHHFQARGLADTKIVIRFWIIAGILAICGLATLKIR